MRDEGLRFCLEGTAKEQVAKYVRAQNAYFATIGVPGADVSKANMDLHDAAVSLAITVYFALSSEQIEQLGVERPGVTP